MIHSCSSSIKTVSVNAIPQGATHVGIHKEESWMRMGFTGNTDVVATLFVRWRVRGGARDHGNSGEESMSLTSDGTVADRRGEGHHFSVGGVKQARDISS